MIQRFKRSVVEREIGIGQAVQYIREGEGPKSKRELRVGDILEYPYKGRAMRIVEMDDQTIAMEAL